MIRRSIIISTVTALSLLTGGQTLAADQGTIYGSQLMTKQERLEYRKKHMNAKTEEERMKLRKEHHALMQQRAKERNMKLPDTPPASGAGMGSGGGMKPGGGMGGGGRY